jgi:dCMP deaminase
MNGRPSKDEYYLAIAKSIAMRSPCIRRQVGAIIVKEDAIASTGYNGPARGVINCIDAGCLKDKKRVPSYVGYEECIAVHGEENAVINAARNGVSIRGGVMYVYGVWYKDKSPAGVRPCDRCKRVIINAGITRVVIMKDDGSIVSQDVSEWVKEDTDNYLMRLKNAEAEQH